MTEGVDEEILGRRLRLPQEGELFGIVTQLCGANHLRVKCEDGKERMCRIPGKLRKRVWIREGDVVLVKPWEYQAEKKGDVVWRYTKTEAGWLEKQGYLKNLV